MFKLITQNLRHLKRNTNLNVKFVSSSTPKQLIEVKPAIENWKKKLRQAGIGDIEFNIKCLVAHVLNRKFHTISTYDNLHFDDKQMIDFVRYCEARCARMPLQHIIGEWDFMDLTLKTAPTVFIPRPETEEFVLKVIKQLKENQTKLKSKSSLKVEPIDAVEYKVDEKDNEVEMLEIGCGSGAMSLAILNRLPHVQCTAIERSKMATALAWENAKLLNLNERFNIYNHTMSSEQFLPAELLYKKFDLIISNPPYVKTHEFPYLAPEVVVYENLNALDGGDDGLNVARIIFDLACVHLHAGGKLWLELGNEHPPLVKTIMNQYYEGRLRYVAGYEDQYEQERFVEIERL